MTLAMMLTVISVAVSVAVMGVLSALTAEDRLARGRGWAFASIGIAIGLVVCAAWHNVTAVRPIALVLVLQGWVLLERLRRDPVAPDHPVPAPDLTTELTP